MCSDIPGAIRLYHGAIKKDPTNFDLFIELKCRTSLFNDTDHCKPREIARADDPFMKIYKTLLAQQVAKPGKTRLSSGCVSGLDSRAVEGAVCFRQEARAGPQVPQDLGLALGSHFQISLHFCFQVQAKVCTGRHRSLFCPVLTVHGSCRADGLLC